jgi:hypothetical protein
MRQRVTKILGVKPHPDRTKTAEGSTRADVTIVGRRSRKEWDCAAGEKCSIGFAIDVDEVYVEHSVGVAVFAEVSRYPVACAIKSQVVQPVENAIDKGNSRRQAIQAQRARREVNAG